jgi:hypothetical protein
MIIPNPVADRAINSEISRVPPATATCRDH